MREDLTLALRRGGINPEVLNTTQRILLTTDGTVTDILEANYREPIVVFAISQEFSESQSSVEELKVLEGHSILKREILLKGKISGCNVLHAETIIVPDRLSPNLRKGLLEKKLPIGHLLLKNKLETYREIIRCERRSANNLAKHFGIYENAPLLSRTYVVTLDSKPIMRITENFPEWGM